MDVSISIIKDPEEKKIGYYQALLSILSLLLVSSIYTLVRWGEWVLIWGPDDEKLVFLNNYLLVILIILSMVGFWKLFGRTISFHREFLNKQGKDYFEFDPDFPILSASKHLSQQSSDLIDQTNALFFLLMLFFGWTIVILPFLILGGIIYLLSFVIPSINVAGSISIGPLVIMLLIWLVGIAITGMVHPMIKQSQEIHYLSGMLSGISLDNENETEDADDSEVNS